jgi:imidazole glycerol-phosphate synthase subunit HisH
MEGFMIAILKYNAGNCRSVENALRRLGVASVVTDDPAVLRASPGVIIPGVGEASSTMRYLTDTGLDAVIRSLTQPVLGICLGMQLLCAWSEEGGDGTTCLGVFPCSVRRFPAELKVPHMGWNTLEHTRGSLFEGLSEAPAVYFVHSYFVERNPWEVALTTHGVTFASALVRDNFAAVQFHPEKSGRIGEMLLRNFADSVKRSRECTVWR